MRKMAITQFGFVVHPMLHELDGMFHILREVGAHRKMFFEDPLIIRCYLSQSNTYRADAPITNHLRVYGPNLEMY